VTRVSVVVPNYNHARYLPIALTGIFDQTRRPDEVIVLDDASTDESWSIIEAWRDRHPDRLRAIRNETNLGMLGNQEKGFRLARGEFVYLHSADDLILPDCLETWCRLLEAHPTAGLATARAVSFREDPDDRIYHNDRWIPEEGYHDPETIADNLFGRYFTSGQVLYRKSVIEAAGGFTRSLGAFCDWFWLHAGAFRHGIVYCPRVLTLFRALDSGIGAATVRDRQKMRIVCIELLRMLQEDHPDLLPFFARSGVMGHLGLEMARLVLSEPAYWAPPVMALVQQNLHNWAAHNQRMRLQDFRALHRSLRDDLIPRVARVKEQCRARGLNRVALYGAGTHTRILAEIWRHEDSGPRLTAVLVSEKGDADACEGLPVHDVRTIDPDTLDAVVLSSNTYEREMSLMCAEHLPEHVPVLAVWEPHRWSRGGD